MNTNTQTLDENKVLTKAEVTPTVTGVSGEEKNSLDWMADLGEAESVDELAVSENAGAILPPRKAIGRRDRFVPSQNESRPLEEKLPLSGEPVLIDLRVTSGAESEGATISASQLKKAFGKDAFEVPTYTQIELALTDGQSIVGYVQWSVKGRERCYAPKAYLPEGIILRLGYVQSVRVAKLIIG